MRYNILIGLTLCISPLKAQVPVETGYQQKSIHYDDHNGLILIEALDPGMTLYSLSRKYNVTIELILASNPDLQPHAIPLGYPVNIPVSPKMISFYPPVDGKDGVRLSYRVQPKETLYHISTVYLKTSPEVILNLNSKAIEGLSIGQILHIGWLVPSKKSDPELGMHADSTVFIPKDFIKAALGEGKVVKIQKGVAVWKPGNLSANYYVLHPTAKLGSFMEITNLMLHRTITAKVAGHIPPGLYQSHVGIVVSPSSARALGVLDQQFFARWRYVE